MMMETEDCGHGHKQSRCYYSTKVFYCLIEHGSVEEMVEAHEVDQSDTPHGIRSNFVRRD